MNPGHLGLEDAALPQMLKVTESQNCRGKESYTGRILEPWNLKIIEL